MKIFSCQNRCKLKPIRNKQAEEIRKSPLAKIGAPPLRLQKMDHLIIKVGPTETEAVKCLKTSKHPYQQYKNVGKKIEQKIRFTRNLKPSLF